MTDAGAEDEAIGQTVTEASGTANCAKSHSRKWKADESETSESIHRTDRNEVLAVIRDLFESGAPRDRNQAVKDIAAALGYQRVGSSIRSALRKDLGTAVRRGILDHSGSQYSLLCRSITEYDRSHLVKILLAAMGSGRWTRDDAIVAAARHLGYRRTGKHIRAAFKSAINAALRRNLLEKDGADWIRRAT